MARHYPDLDSASYCMKQFFNQSEAPSRFGWQRVISLEFLGSRFLRIGENHWCGHVAKRRLFSYAEGTQLTGIYHYSGLAGQNSPFVKGIPLLIRTVPSDESACVTGDFSVYFSVVINVKREVSEKASFSLNDRSSRRALTFGTHIATRADLLRE